MEFAFDMGIVQQSLNENETDGFVDASGKHPFDWLVREILTSCPTPVADEVLPQRTMASFDVVWMGNGRVRIDERLNTSRFDVRTVDETAAKRRDIPCNNALKVAAVGPSDSGVVNSPTSDQMCANNEQVCSRVASKDLVIELKADCLVPGGLESDFLVHAAEVAAAPDPGDGRSTVRIPTAQTFVCGTTQSTSVKQYHGQQRRVPQAMTLLPALVEAHQYKMEDWSDLMQSCDSLGPIPSDWHPKVNFSVLRAKPVESTIENTEAEGIKRRMEGGFQYTPVIPALADTIAANVEQNCQGTSPPRRQLTRVKEHDASAAEKLAIGAAIAQSDWQSSSRMGCAYLQITSP
ncbi:hypothetical protein C8F01DRAFT_1345484 [Mycena amicta]|nr:hypothetical protein C8F01DRAFT_1345484 [Mycena amicta]